jgi:hypothetical protein
LSQSLDREKKEHIYEISFLLAFFVCLLSTYKLDMTVLAFAYRERETPKNVFCLTPPEFSYKCNTNMFFSSKFRQVLWLLDTKEIQSFKHISDGF